MWITNSPDDAEKLKAADAAWQAARNAAQHLPLAEKVAAYRKAKTDRQAAYDAINPQVGRPV